MLRKEKEKKVVDMFVKGVQILEDIAREVLNDYKVDVMIEDKSGEFIEVPITTYKKGIIEKILLNILKKSKSFQKSGDGNGLKFYRSKIKELFPYYQFLSLHNRIPFFFERNIFKSKNNYINIISHPKSISANSIDLIKILSNLDNKFINIYDFYNQVSN